ncbi:glycosyltransferase [Flavihumibacter sp. RY-1]|uniref:Glycosyltransferase n=1 Tax=Flavihumibacter fluminis TaxID=2909236 RepID=A0ABS9BMQ9_9BACT|nr:glycosyltransferase family 2 protein [Flavihumibacter fluminis]MCF1716403.1 glycosyltransferase [Flavihumibacter fluminis]
MEPLVTIITATYNSAATLADTLESVASQTYPRIEHLIIDGVSIDDTAAIIARYPHVARFVSEPDKGLYDAMNKGIKLASGDIIGILNSDDFYADNRVIEKIVELFQNPDTLAVYADLQYVDAEDTSKVIRYWKAGTYDQQAFYYGWMPPHPSFFVRKQLYEQCGVFNTSFRHSADYELMLRFLLRYNAPAAYLPQVVVKMRMGGQSNASFRNRWKANREDRRAWTVNGLTPYFFTIPLKPFRKIGQFLIK